MSSEGSPNIFAYAPLDPSLYDVLTEEHGVADRDIGRYIAIHRCAIEGDRRLLAIALTESGSATSNNSIDAIEPLTPQEENFRTYYKSKASDPEEKLRADVALVQGLLGELGQTNRLRRPDGSNAYVELEQFKRLLRDDYYHLPPELQQPRRRYVEALVAEEQALLWEPTALLVRQVMLGSTANADGRQRIDITLCEEAADLFSVIAASSDTHTLGLKLEAFARATDLRVRSLRLRATQVKDSQELMHIEREITHLATNSRHKIFGAASRKPDNCPMPDGQLFELISLEAEREALLRQGRRDRFVRLALPREDFDPLSIRAPIIGAKAQRVNLSADIVVENLKGKIISTPQVKAYAQEKHSKVEAKRHPGRSNVYVRSQTPIYFLGQVSTS